MQSHREASVVSPVSRSILDTYKTLQAELIQGLTLYRNTAEKILKGSGIHLKASDPKDDAIHKHFFTAIFLYSYYRAGISPERRIVYTALNQCLRGMVTGCDNLLDNEYKQTLCTDLPPSSTKFRSIIDIMVSDRAVAAILDKGFGDNLTRHDLLEASFESLRALTISGVEEAREEEGVRHILPPEDILSRIHHEKTGVLFTCPWAIPDMFETRDPPLVKTIKEGLYGIGMGCQILDDMADLAMDLNMHRHNYVASLIFHGDNNLEKKRLHSLMQKNTINGPDGKNQPQLFPHAFRLSWQKARSLLMKGGRSLFGSNHEFMVDTTIHFLLDRLGVNALIQSTEA